MVKLGRGSASAEDTRGGVAPRSTGQQHMIYLVRNTPFQTWPEQGPRGSQKGPKNAHHGTIPKGAQTPRPAHRARASCQDTQHLAFKEHVPRGTKADYSLIYALKPEMGNPQVKKAFMDHVIYVAFLLKDCPRTATSPPPTYTGSVLFSLISDCERLCLQLCAVRFLLCLSRPQKRYMSHITSWARGTARRLWGWVANSPPYCICMYFPRLNSRDLRQQIRVQSRVFFRSLAPCAVSKPAICIPLTD